MKYGYGKSNSLEICGDLCTEDCDIALRGKAFDIVEMYKYLGVIENNKGDLSDHIEMVRKKVIVVTSQIKKITHERYVL